MTVEDAIAAAVVARLEPIVERIVGHHVAELAASVRAATPARGLSVAEYAERAGVSVCTVRRLCADNSLPHKRLGKRIVIPADAVPGTAERDRIGELAMRARAGR